MTADALSGGRFGLGLGSSGPGVITGWHSMPYERPLDRIRDYVNIVRMIVRRERVRYDGSVVSVKGALRLMPEPVRERIPVYLRSISRRGTMLAAEIADGWLPKHFAPRHFATVMSPVLSDGLAAAGRSREDIEVLPYRVPIVCTGDPAAGLDADRPRLALHIGGMGTLEKNYYKDLRTLRLHGGGGRDPAAVPGRRPESGRGCGTRCPWSPRARSSGPWTSADSAYETIRSRASTRLPSPSSPSPARE